MFEPVAGAYVTTFRFNLEEYESNLESLPVTGQDQTDDEGRFTIHLLNPGLHMVVAQVLDHRPSVYLADIDSSATTVAEIVVVGSGDNPSTFSTVGIFKSHRPAWERQAQWRVEGAAPFQEPLPGERNGWLFLRARNNRNTFGYYQSAEGWLHRIPSSLYQVTFVVATDQPNPAESPGVRLRANSSSLMQSDIFRISSLGDAGLAPTPDGRMYDLFFEPLDTNAFLPRGLDRINMSFDIINIDEDDAPEGEVILKSLEIDAHPLAQVETSSTLKLWGFDTGPEGWEAQETVPPFDSAQADWEDGALVLSVSTQGDTFGYWTSPDDGFTAPEEGALIRALFTVRSNQGDPTLVSGLRVRLQTADHQVAIMKAVPSVGEALDSPDLNGKVYPVYFQVPPGVAGEPLLFSIDVLGFDTNDADDNVLYLEQVEVQEVDIDS
jgi:hypothetical protein